jgi:rhodanese-related sulfurtransferase
MDPHTVARRRKHLQVLDVREDVEWAAGHIEGAVHIALGALSARQGELDRDQPVVTVCRAGSRAGKAARALTDAGWSVEVMDGGMQGWQRAGLPLSTPDGHPGTVA